MQSTLSRRLFVATSAAALFVAVKPVAGQAQGGRDAVAARDPVAIVTAIYRRAARGKGDDGGQFVWLEPRDRAKYFSRPLLALWAKADAATPEGDQGPMGFDPVTNSQDPSVKSFKAVAERQDAATATVAATFEGHHGRRALRADETVRYDFVHENGAWKIDDIRGAVDAKPWSVREMLNSHLRTNPAS